MGLFFASSNDLVGRFDYAGDPETVVIDLSGAHIREASSAAALDAVENKYAQRGKTIDGEGGRLRRGAALVVAGPADRAALVGVLGRQRYDGRGDG